MLSKSLLVLAAAGLATEVVASGHGHVHHQMHHQRRALVTEMTTVTDWVTVTVYESPKQTQAAVKHFTRKKHTRKPLITTKAPSAQPAVPTTLVVETKAPAPSVEAPAAEPKPPVVEAPAQPAEPAPAPEPETSAPAPNPEPAPAPAPTPVPAPAPPAIQNPPTNPAPVNPAPKPAPAPASASGGRRRGLAYNDPNLLKRFVNPGNKIGWTYNWGQVDDSGLDLEFTPTLWGTTKGFPATWAQNAQKAIDTGSTCLFSFNEPDIESQANMSPQDAARAHIELMGPFAGKARIGTPSVSNSEAGHQGPAWLKQWVDACAGRCPYDFVNIHIYGYDRYKFLEHLKNVYRDFQKPIFITEFGFSGSEEKIAEDLAYVLEQIETTGEYDFVERYSFFFVADGYMVKGNSVSPYGNVFAYGA